MRSDRILYVITLPDLGGAQTHVRSLIARACREYDVHLATSARGPLTEDVQAYGATVHLVPGLARAIDPLADLRAINACVDLVHKINPRLIHAHSSKAGVLARVAARIARVPVIFTAHGWGFAPGVPAMQRLAVWVSEMLTARLAAKIICVSHYDRRLAERYRLGGRDLLVTIHNGLDCEADRAAPDRQPVDIVMTARFHRQKDQQTLVRAFALLNRSDARLVFIGAGPELPACRALVRALGIEARVRFLGERRDIAALLAQAQIFALISRYEGLPISILEAMRAGLPVVASDVGGVCEALEHGVTGLLTPRGDVQAVAAALQTLLADPQLRRRMGEAGRQRFLRSFTLDRMVARTQALYQAVVEEHHRSCIASPR